MQYYDYLTEFVFVEDEPARADYIFVPGSGFGELAQKAAALYQAGFAAKIVVSGKHSILKPAFEGPLSPEAYVGRHFETESDFLEALLLEEGVPQTAVLKENQATYTYENAIRTRELLGAEKVERAILVCQAFHAKRCLLYYQLLFPDTRFFVCPAVTRDITRDNWYLSAEKIDVVLGEVERCGSQFRNLLLKDAKRLLTTPR